MAVYREWRGHHGKGRLRLTMQAKYSLATTRGNQSSRLLRSRKSGPESFLKAAPVTFTDSGAGTAERRAQASHQIQNGIKLILAVATVVLQLFLYSLFVYLRCCVTFDPTAPATLYQQAAEQSELFPDCCVGWAAISFSQHVCRSLGCVAF